MNHVYKFTLLLVALTAALLLPGGCGGNDLMGEVTALLEQRSGEIETIGYVCMTEDGERLYREEFALRFPHDYRYRFYEYTGGQPRLRNLAVQSGNDLYRASVAPGSSGQAGAAKVETLSNIPPLRCTGTYLALYHLAGNVDYFQSLISLIKGGELEVVGVEDVDGIDTYLLQSAGGLKPEMRIWLDQETGLPSRKELTLGEGRVVVFRYEDFVENATYTEEPFPPDARALFGEQLDTADVVTRDGGCQPVALADIPSQAGFSPLLPEIPGFELADSYLRDPAASTLASSEESVKFPEGWREIYLVMRSGSRQVEIRESPYDPEFGYYTTAMGALSGAFLTGQEVFGEDAGNASYIAAMDCQEMRLTLGEIDLMVTGDLSREELEVLAIQLKDLAD